MSKYKDTFDINIARVNTLCSLYKTLRDLGVAEKSKNRLTDILRSAVVLLHSSFEEYFRTILCTLLPNHLNAESIKNIDFVGSEGKHNEKITWSQLLSQKGKTVDQLIIDSVNESLNAKSFNNYKEIVKWTKIIEISLDSFKYISELEELIKRRHKIVHEADNKQQSGNYELTTIKEDTVNKWITVVVNLVNLIDSQIVSEG